MSYEAQKLWLRNHGELKGRLAEAMTWEHNRITEITDDELYELYLRRGMDELMDFNEYKRRMRKAGVLVIEGGSLNEEAKA